MITKETLMKRSDNLIEQLRSEQINFFFLLLESNTKKTSESYLDKLIDFQKDICSTSDDSNSLLDLHKRYIELERNAQRRAVILGTFPSILFLYIAMTSAFFIATSVDIPKFVESTLGVKTPGKLITLGILGAFLYLATSALTHIENNSEKIGFSSTLQHSIRFFLAVIVPIILVVLFFDGDGTLKEITLSPELLSFCCGYSAKLVVELFNKVIEKGSKIISTL